MDSLMNAHTCKQVLWRKGCFLMMVINALLMVTCGLNQSTLTCSGHCLWLDSCTVPG